MTSSRDAMETVMYLFGSLFFVGLCFCCGAWVLMDRDLDQPLRFGANGCMGCKVLITFIFTLYLCINISQTDMIDIYDTLSEHECHGEGLDNPKINTIYDMAIAVCVFSSFIMCGVCINVVFIIEDPQN